MAKRTSGRVGFSEIECGSIERLLDQFITEYTNLRDNEYNASPWGRIRYAAEIVAAVWESVPADFVVGVRVSEGKVNNYTYRWPGGVVEAETIFTALAEAGASYIHMAGEGRAFRESICGEHEPLTTLARRITGLPVIANGGLHNPDVDDDVIERGDADLIALGRAALATPDWPKRISQSDPVVAFDHGMISPKASIENTDAWFQRRTNSQRLNAFDAIGGQDALVELRGFSYESSGERFGPAQGRNPAHDNIKASSFTVSLLWDVENDRLSFDWQREIFNPPHGKLAY